MAQNYTNFCFCGHDYVAGHNNGGNCTICTDVHAFVPRYQHNSVGAPPPQQSGYPYATNVLSSSQV